MPQQLQEIATAEKAGSGFEPGPAPASDVLGILDNQHSETARPVRANYDAPPISAVRDGPETSSPFAASRVRPTARGSYRNSLVAATGVFSSTTTMCVSGTKLSVTGLSPPEP